MQREKERKKIEMKTQLRMPSRKAMTTRRPEWREVAKTCGKLGHWIQHHTFECVNNRICKVIADSVFCVKSYAQMLMQYKIQLTIEMYNSSINLINRHFREQLISLRIPDVKEDYTKLRRKIDLAPRLYNAIVRQRKGTSGLISYLNKGKYTPAVAIQENWKMESRVKKAEGKSALERRCLDRSRIEVSQKIIYKDNRMISENEIISTDETSMIESR